VGSCGAFGSSAGSCLQRTIDKVGFVRRVFQAAVGSFGALGWSGNSTLQRTTDNGPLTKLGSFVTFSIIDAVDGGFVCHVYDSVNRTVKWRILAHSGAFGEGSVADPQSQK
jgi:hypothetical protein